MVESFVTGYAGKNKRDCSFCDVFLRNLMWYQRSFGRNMFFQNNLHVKNTANITLFCLSVGHCSKLTKAHTVIFLYSYDTMYQICFVSLWQLISWLLIR